MKDIKIVTQKQLNRMEPKLKGSKALLSPSSGIFDVKGFVDKLFEISKKNKVNFYFNRRNLILKKINSKFQINIKKKHLFDYVINCTGQQSFKLNKLNLTYEHCLISLYKPKNKNHKSYTIMDGPYYTLIRWSKDLFALYSVKHSRLLTSKNYEKVKRSYLNFKLKNKIKENLTKGFFKFYPKFKNNFKFIRNLHMIRTIIKNKKDARLCIVKNNNNFINVMPGKIDHVFYAFEEVLKCIKTY